MFSAQPGIIARDYGGDSGGASRFFHQSKLESGDHKPIALLRYLCKLITARGGTILDPFVSSKIIGSAAIQEGFKFIGISQVDGVDPETETVAESRVMESTENEGTVIMNSVLGLFE